MQCFITGFSSYPVRMEYFSVEQMKERHGQEHQMVAGKEVDSEQKGGYPDNGNGKYTIAAGYKCWYEMNLRQRVHGHYLEGIAQLLCCELVAGFYLPKVITILGATYFLARLGFNIAYMGGP